MLVASPAYLRRAGVPESMGDLASHACVQMRFADGTTSAWSFKQGKGRRAGALQPKAAITANDSDAVIDLALANAGIAHAGLFHAIAYLRSGRLKLGLGHLHDPGSREFVLHCPHRQYLSPRVRVVVDHLRAHFAQASDLHLGVDELPPQFHAIATPASRGSLPR